MNSPDDILKVGDRVRSHFGEVRIKRMELTEEPNDKYGRRVTETTWAMVDACRVVFDFDNGHWGYSRNIERIS